VTRLALSFPGWDAYGFNHEVSNGGFDQSFVSDLTARIPYLDVLTLHIDCWGVLAFDLMMVISFDITIRKPLS